MVSANPRSKIDSVSGKDRGAIHPAAHVRSAYVYWFEGAFGRFVTSTYYRASDPKWITAFNSGTLQTHRSETSWDLSAPASALSKANRDLLFDPLRAEVRRRAFKPAVDACRIVPGALPLSAGVVGAVATFRAQTLGDL